jgi:hypothetical protein
MFPLFVFPSCDSYSGVFLCGRRILAAFGHKRYYEITGLFKTGYFEEASTYLFLERSWL